MRANFNVGKGPIASGWVPTRQRVAERREAIGRDVALREWAPGGLLRKACALGRLG
jgi:hypothetical protein